MITWRLHRSEVDGSSSESTGSGSGHESSGAGITGITPSSGCSRGPAILLWTSLALDLTTRFDCDISNSHAGPAFLVGILRDLDTFLGDGTFVPFSIGCIFGACVDGHGCSNCQPSGHLCLATFITEELDFGEA